MTGRRGSRRNQPTRNYRESSPSEPEHSHELTEENDPRQPLTREPHPDQPRDPAREMDHPPSNEGDNLPSLQDRKFTPEMTEPLTHGLEESRTTTTCEENLTGNNELDLLRERRLIMELTTAMSQQLNELKRDRSTTLEPASVSPTLLKRKAIFKPQAHTESYRTTTYEASRQYIAKIDSQAQLRELTDSEAVSMPKQASRILNRIFGGITIANRTWRFLGMSSKHGCYRD